MTHLYSRSRSYPLLCLDIHGCHIPARRRGLYAIPGFDQSTEPTDSAVRLLLPTLLIYKRLVEMALRHIRLLIFRQSPSHKLTGPACLPLPSNPTSLLSSPVLAPTPRNPRSGYLSWTRRLHKSQSGLPPPMLSSTKTSNFTPGTGLPFFPRTVLLPDP
jgi:hypothetical protein